MSNRGEKLSRELGLWDVVAIVIGSIIGAGIFRAPSSIANIIPSAGLVLLAWMVGGGLSLCGALCYAELAASFPQAGGDYVYLREAYGSWCAFLLGWTNFLVIRTGSMASVAFIFAGYWHSFFHLSPLALKGIAASTILFLTLINLWALRYGKQVQNFTTLLKVLALTLIILFGLILARGNIENFFPLPSPRSTLGLLGAFGWALIFVLWTYGGWADCTYVAGEVKNPGRNLPLAIFIGTVGVIIIYLLINIIYIYYLPLAETKQTEEVAARVMHSLLGVAGEKIISILVLVSTFGALNALILTGGRLSYALAQDNVLFAPWAEIHKKYKTPAVALSVNSLWSILLVFSGTFERLISYTSVACWFFFGLSGLSLFILRKKFPKIPRPYQVWGYPLLPVFFISMSGFLMLNTIVQTPVESLLGISIMLVGIPVFILSKHLESKKSSS